ncbi:outer membrane beta-barrel protein [Mangrovimonas sp. TPBH4]|uniref:outer membrane beta-barrel protein n=1 Tax=Mangrovimonas sp. TPBH4 TaxID=1645914 RepID=UPI0006B69B31|nr:outer membrane beta-barrel protein [Mangrovimonas sp. TPBH4]
MKQFIFLFSLFLGLTQFTFSQEKSQDYQLHTTTFGFKAGLNQSFIVPGHYSIDGYQGLELYGGFFSETRLTERWSFQNELVFSYTDEYLFLEIPLVMKYHITDKFSAFGGAKIDLILNDELTKEHLRRMGVSLEIGVQYDFSRKFFAEARFGYGLVDQIYIEDFYGGYRNTLRVGVGYKF